MTDLRIFIFLNLNLNFELGPVDRFDRFTSRYDRFGNFYFLNSNLNFELGPVWYRPKPEPGRTGSTGSHRFRKPWMGQGLERESSCREQEKFRRERGKKGRDLIRSSAVQVLRKWTTFQVSTLSLSLSLSLSWIVLVQQESISEDTGKEWLPLPPGDRQTPGKARETGEGTQTQVSQSQSHSGSRAQLHKSCTWLFKNKVLCLSYAAKPNSEKLWMFGTYSFPYSYDTF